MLTFDRSYKIDPDVKLSSATIAEANGGNTKWKIHIMVYGEGHLRVLCNKTFEDLSEEEEGEAIYDHQLKKGENIFSNTRSIMKKLGLELSHDDTTRLISYLEAEVLTSKEYFKKRVKLLF